MDNSNQSPTRVQTILQMIPWESLDAHFDIVGMLDEYEEAEQDEALATPDVITGEEPDIKEENYEKT